ncbi:MAG: hypothetical protein ACI8Y4_003301 [Candidatus Poriferisodalaceae bacterium]|jgi:hypothetical protein
MIRHVNGRVHGGSREVHVLLKLSGKERTEGRRTGLGAIHRRFFIHLLIHLIVHLIAHGFGAGSGSRRVRVGRLDRFLCGCCGVVGDCVVAVAAGGAEQGKSRDARGNAVLANVLMNGALHGFGSFLARAP